MVPTASLFGSPSLDGRVLPYGLVAAVVGVAIWIYRRAYFIPFPSNIAFIGERPGRTSFSLRTRWRYMTDCQALYFEAWNKYLKHGKPVVVPGFGFVNELILPQSAMKWATSQPEEVLGTYIAIVEVDQVEASFGHPKFVLDAWQGTLIKTEMNAVLENIVASLNNELGVAVDKYFGTDTETWKEVDLLKAVSMMAAQAASRFTVGSPLCRNEAYLKDLLSINDVFVMNAGLTRGSPFWLRPLVARLVCARLPTLFGRLQRLYEPLIKERLEYLKYKKGDPAHPEPEDHLQMMLRFAKAERPDELHDLPVLTKRLATASFASIHQISIQITNMLLNILGSDAEFNTISVLRDEIKRVVGSDVSSGWTKAKIASMPRTDSVGRETMRLHSFGNRAVFRQVMVDDLELEDGVKLPKGAICSFMGWGAQTDPEYYEDSLKFDPFRFSRAREAAIDAEGKLGLNHLSFVSLSPNYLPFSYGKHACPGRFLVDFELKIFTSYILSKYDLEFPAQYGGKRPPNEWMAEASMPPSGVTIRVRRRKDSE